MDLDFLNKALNKIEFDYQWPSQQNKNENFIVKKLIIIIIFARNFERNFVSKPDQSLDDISQEIIEGQLIKQIQETELEKSLVHDPLIVVLSYRDPYIPDKKRLQSKLKQNSILICYRKEMYQMLRDYYSLQGEENARLVQQSFKKYFQTLQTQNQKNDLFNQDNKKIEKRDNKLKKNMNNLP